MSRFIYGSVVLLISLIGCATYPDVNRQRMENLPQHYAQFDAVIGWEVIVSGNETLISGEFKNIRYYKMDNVEIWVAALDAKGKPIARSVSYVIPHMLQQGEVTPFTVRLPVAVAPGSKLRFTYKYTGVEAASSEGGGDIGDWMQTFYTVVSAR